jgi:hypothetical protein
MFCLNMLRMSIELSERDAVYEDMPSSSWSTSSTSPSDDRHGQRRHRAVGLTGQFLLRRPVDAVRTENPHALRSMVGLIPLFAVGIVEQAVINKRPTLAQDRTVPRARPDLVKLVSRWNELGSHGRRLFSLARAFRMTRLLQRMLDESEFLSPTECELCHAPISIIPTISSTTACIIA